MKKVKTKLLVLIILVQIIAIPTISLCQPAWTRKKNLDIVQYRACNFVIEDKAYVGLGLKEKDGTPIKDFYAFDPSANTWTKIADFPGAARYFAVAFSINNKGYVGLGTDGTTKFKDVWEYDPISNQWTQKTDFPAVGRNGAVAITIGAKGYVGLGISGTTRFKDWWEYDPTDATNGNDSNGNPKGKWTQRTSFGGTERGFAIGFSASNKGYVGFGNDGTYQNDLWEYDPSQGTNGEWTSKSRTIGSQRSVAASFAIGNKGYIVSGNYINNGSLNYLRDIWEYDIADDSWKEKHTFPAASRAAAVGFVINSKAYFGTGYTASDSLKSDIWEFNPLAPRKPELNLFSISDTEINISWIDNSDNETGFQLEQSIGNNTNFQLIQTLTGVNFNAVNLLEGKKYFYRLRAINGPNYSDYSSVKSAFTFPTAPSQLTAATSGSEINLKWIDNSSGEGGYLIERSSGDNSNFKAIATVTPNTTLYKDIDKTGNKILPETTYYYRVAATNSIVLSAYSNEVNVKTLPTLQAPSEFKASSAPDLAITLTWKDNSDNETNFVIQRSVGNSSAYTDLITLNANVTSYKDQVLSPSTVYYYRIKAINASGSSAYSQDASAETLITGIEDNIPENEIIVFPNPVQNIIYVTITGNTVSNITYQLTNSTGQSVKKGKLINGVLLNIQDLNPGIYYLNISTLKGSTVKKIMKF